MTRRPAIEPRKAGIATPAGARPAANRRVLRTGGSGPTRGLDFPLASVALDLAPIRPGHGPRAATDEDVMLRLALWLADVAAEAALEKPPVGESAP
jgi:hypothetical protein